EAVRRAGRGAEAGAAENAWSRYSVAAGTVVVIAALPGVDIRRKSSVVHGVRQWSAAHDVGRIRRIGIDCKGAVARLEVRYLDAVGAGEQLRIRNGPEEADAADPGIPSVADEHRAHWRPFLGELAVSGLRGITQE